MEIHCSASNRIGRRHNDEDAHVNRPDLGLVVVADGMGGYDGGEIASRIVVDSGVREHGGCVGFTPQGGWVVPTWLKRVS